MDAVRKTAVNTFVFKYFVDGHLNELIILYIGCQVVDEPPYCQTNKLMKIDFLYISSV